MKKKVIIFASLFLVLVVLKTPATLLKSFVPNSSKISLSNLQGTIWSGKIGQIAVQDIVIDDLAFSLNFVDLLTAKLGADLDFTQGDILGQLGVTFSDQNSFDIQDANLSINASMIESKISFKGIQLFGELVFTDLAAKVSNKRLVLLDGQSTWSKASVAFAGNDWTLGDFKLQWKTQSASGNILGDILPSKNQLGLQGQVIINKAGLLDFKGSISTDIDRKIYNAFLLFANGKVNNGRLPIKFKKKIF